MKLETIDLRAISRDSDKRTCTVWMRDENYHQMAWLKMGEANLTRGNEDQWRLYARMNATDFEHDSAYVCILPLIGVTLSFVSDHRMVIQAWINPDEDSRDFHVPPSSDYNPMALPDTQPCTECKKPHPIVPEGYYTPKFDRKLFELVRGRKVEIHFSPVWPETEDEDEDDDE